MIFNFSNQPTPFFLFIHGKRSSLQSKRSIYQFATQVDGSVSMTQIKRSSLPAEGPEGDPKEFVKEDPPSARMLRGSSIESSHRRLNDLTIDILVPFTRRALCGLSKATNPTSCTATDGRLRMMQNHINLAIQEGNVAFSNSGISGRLRLAYSYLVDDYDESQLAYSDILWNMGYRTDGKLDDMQEIREKYKADVVVMLVDNSSSCGLTFSGFPVSRSWAFSAVNWACAIGYYTFVHEVMHFLGAQHDRSTKLCPGTMCCEGQCSNFGWIDPKNRFRSIMSYDCPTENEYGCPRVQYFSQTTKYYELLSSDGLTSRYIRIGDRYNNNARVIRQNFATVAAYY